MSQGVFGADIRPACALGLVYADHLLKPSNDQWLQLSNEWMESVGHSLLCLSVEDTLEVGASIRAQLAFALGVEK